MRDFSADHSCHNASSMDSHPHLQLEAWFVGYLKRNKLEEKNHRWHVVLKKTTTFAKITFAKRSNAILETSAAW